MWQKAHDRCTAPSKSSLCGHMRNTGIFPEECCHTKLYRLRASSSQLLSAMKRSSSPKLTAHASPFHSESSVTLIQAEDGSGPSTPRRSKRVKLDQSTSNAIPDMEDTIVDKNYTPTERLVTPNFQRESTSSPRKPKAIP